MPLLSTLLTITIRPALASAFAISSLRASAFLTSDCEIPNCRAMAEGFTPALKEASTAFIFPFVRPPAIPSTAVRRPAGFASTCGWGLGRRPRRSASVVTAASNLSISASSNRLSDPARSFGNKCRGAKAGWSAANTSFVTAGGSDARTEGGAENRSGV